MLGFIVTRLFKFISIKLNFGTGGTQSLLWPETRNCLKLERGYSHQEDTIVIVVCVYNILKIKSPGQSGQYRITEELLHLLYGQCHYLRGGGGWSESNGCLFSPKFFILEIVKISILLVDPIRHLMVWPKGHICICVSQQPGVWFPRL